MKSEVFSTICNPKEEKKLREAEFEAGVESGKREIILNMYREGFSIDQIEKAVQMKETEIRKIIEKVNNKKQS